MRAHERSADADEQEIIDEEPTVDDAMGFVLECWKTLDSARQLGHGFSGAIPYQAIDLWSRRKAVDSQLFDVLVAVISFLDGQRAERISSELAYSRGA